MQASATRVTGAEWKRRPTSYPVASAWWVASPVSRLGVVLYGALIGTLVVVIRCWGGMPEGVMYAILLGNAVSPHLDRLIQPVAFGARKRKP